MFPIVLKYIQFICVAVLFEKINCDQLQLDNPNNDHLLYQTIGCTAICLNSDSKLVILTLKRFQLMFWLTVFCNLLAAFGRLLSQLYKCEIG